LTDYLSAVLGVLSCSSDLQMMTSLSAEVPEDILTPHRAAIEVIHRLFSGSPTAERASSVLAVCRDRCADRPELGYITAAAQMDNQPVVGEDRSSPQEPMTDEPEKEISSQEHLDSSVLHHLGVRYA
jgi:hypothetical protein